MILFSIGIFTNNHESKLKQRMKRLFFVLLSIVFSIDYASCITVQPEVSKVLGIIHKVNQYWQRTHPKPGWAFWDAAAYHTGNMEAFFLTGDTAYYNYSEAWAEHNQWMGAKSRDKAKWKSSYGESNEYVLFGDFQICFQTYIDLYTVKPDTCKIVRAREVMEYEMSTDRIDYWWWADGLYMVMPVMTKLFKVTRNPLYLEKLHEYWTYANSIMYDEEAGLYYRDAKYVYPKHKSINGKKDFWARGDGWVLAALAKVLTDLPENDKYRLEYTKRFQTLSKSIAACQQPEGYWTRSMLDPKHAPGPETSGTAFFTYGLLWGINNGLLDKGTYYPVVMKAWNYLSEIALQANGRVGYVQPIGEKAIPGQIVDANSTANFGVGAFLLAACEMVRFLNASPSHVVSEPIEMAMQSVFPYNEQGKIYSRVTDEGAWCWFADPRALHYESKDGNINKTYVGYIDIHGNIKAMQYDFNKNVKEEVLVRSYFQPDDHNNPTFLILPDERVMIFYSRHTDESCFYYRVSRVPGDITTLGEEKKILTINKTTYPSPFMLSDDPEHIYLCWRGINWHPTIAKLSLPDDNDNVNITWGPYQIIQSTGARPYAKYMSNGKDKIYLAYTTGHPDPELPNLLYFNYINIRTLQLEDVKGRVVSTISKNPFWVNKKKEFVKQYSDIVVDNSGKRDWVWQVAKDERGNPVIAMVRISGDKTSHDYYYVRWNGEEWKKTFLDNAGGHFHQTPHVEMCYSGGMAIDPENINIVYCSVPKKGVRGKIYEILKYTLDEEGHIASKEAITVNSLKNNVRPYIIPNSAGTPLRLVWMYGDYYDWIVSSKRPLGYCTAICSDFKGFSSGIGVKQQKNSIKNITNLSKYKFNPKKSFVLLTTITLDIDNYQGVLLELGKLCYYLNGVTLKPEIWYNGQVYASTNILGTADGWANESRGTNGKWYAPQKYSSFQLKLEYKDGVLRSYINGLLDQNISLHL